MKKNKSNISPIYRGEFPINQVYNSAEDLCRLFKKAESNIKYKNQIILSEKQADICHRYMDYRESYTNYGRIGYLSYNIDGYFCIVQNRERYTFLNIAKIVKNENEIKAKKN